MTFEVITMWYNEEFLAPFFLNHYWQAKQITIFYDNATRDNTLEEIANHNESIKVKLQTINLDQGLDEFRKIRYINEAYKRSKCDYVIVADADEFVFYEDCRFKRRIYWCALAQIMRTPYDPELDSRLPIDTWSYGFQEKLMIKPSIIRTGLKALFTVGHHGIEIKGKRIHRKLPQIQGAHWNMIEPEFYFNRILKDRMPRQSLLNINKGLDTHYNNRTIEDLKKEYSENLLRCKKLW